MASAPDLAPGKVLRDDDISIALQKLAALGDGKRVPVPFRYEPERPFTLTQADMDDAATETVPLDKIIALEPDVKRKRVRQCIEREGPGKAHMAQRPWLVCCKGKYYCLDGHHRLTAMDLLGEDTVRANVVQGRPK